MTQSEFRKCLVVNQSGDCWFLYRFIESLRNKLHILYPLHQNATTFESAKKTVGDTMYIYYPGEFNYREICPILTCFCLLFFYYYFSVRKIELVKSKLGMAIAVVATVLFSLSMTFGVCFFFGLTLSLQVCKHSPLSNFYKLIIFNLTGKGDISLFSNISGTWERAGPN